MTDTTTTANLTIDDTTAQDTTPAKPKRARKPRSNKSESKPTSAPKMESKPAPSFWSNVKDQLSARNSKLAFIVTMSAFLPALSLFLSHKGGTLLAQSTAIVSTTSALALLSFALCTFVLAISLPHLAWSVEDITKTTTIPSWILAIAFDLSIVACELLATAGHGDTTTKVVMWALATLSALLNCWAFIRQPGEEEKQARKATKLANANNAA